MSLPIFFSSSRGGIEKKKLRLLCIGLGSCMQEVLAQLRKRVLGNKEAIFLEVVGGVDDEKAVGEEVGGVQVLGGLKDFPSCLRRLNINFVLIGLEKFSRDQLDFFLKQLDFREITVKIVPSREEFLKESQLPRTHLENLRELHAEDLLGRKEMYYEISFLEATFSGKTILVTGAGGTIGSAICRKLLSFPIKELLCLSRSEHSLYLLKEVLEKENRRGLKLTYFLGNIKDYSRLEEIVSYSKPDFIFHTAAHKHVFFMEENQKEAIKNNVFGTENLLRLARKHGVGRFIFISTDKAVNPTNFMGLSKRLAEFLVLYYHEKYRLCTANLRFGNVIGSRGSVVPLFRKQIYAGGPVTVTDPAVERYFMTIEKAALLTLVAASGGALPMPKRGDSKCKWGRTYFLEMGEPVRIDSLVRKLLRIEGYGDGDGIAILYTGLKLGEKLYEELVGAQEKIVSTTNDQIYEAISEFKDYAGYYKKYLWLREHFAALTVREVREATQKILI